MGPINSAPAPIVDESIFKLNVILNFMNGQELIKDVPTRFVRDPKTNQINNDKILLAPVIDCIKKMGKPIQNREILYYSENWRMDVFVGTDPIGLD